MPRVYTRLSLSEKFNRHITSKPETGCWLWSGARLKRGYGHMGHDGKYLLAHRVAYELEFGPIPEGLLVLHECDNPTCVRPSHLLTGTHADNTADMLSKGRGRKPETYLNPKRVTHCKRGHEMTPDNIIWTGHGKTRRCRVCTMASARIRNARMRSRRVLKTRPTSA